jgi:ABC-type uncharacterized transport system involved in gliding motility auxiliary subunit
VEVSVAARNLVTGSTAAAAAVLVVALVAMINWLSFRHYYRADWTSSSVYSLSEKTRNIVDDLAEDVQVVVFMTPATPLYEQTRELLARYEAISGRVRVELIDPDRDPLRTQQLAQQFGVSVANTVVFRSGDQTKYVTADQLAEYDYSGMQFGEQPRMRAFRGEEQFTSAMLAVVDPHRPTVCFSTGHGERDLAGHGPDGLADLAEAIGRDNLASESITLLGGSVPEQCDAVVVAGPSAPFTGAEVQALESFLGGGGRLLVLLDPVLAEGQRPSGLEALLTRHGVEVGNDLVVDPSRRLPFYDLSAVYASDFREHPVTRGMERMAVLLPVARSVGAAPVEGAMASVLLTTSPDGWGETDISGILAQQPVERSEVDTPGPVSLGVAAEAQGDDEPAWRLVAIGDSDFVVNDQLANAGNRTLAMNAINWLVEREQALGIAPRQPEQVQLYLSAGQMRLVTLVSLVALPGLAVLIGVVVWLRRRR